MQIGTYLIAISIFMTCLVTTSHAAQSPSNQRILTYEIWKSRRVHEAKDIYSKLIREYKTAYNRDSKSAKVVKLSRRLEQARINIDIAKDLNAHDYFINYLTENFPNDDQIIKSALKKMKSDDVTEILIQYQNSYLSDRIDKRRNTIHFNSEKNNSATDVDFERITMGKAAEL